MQKTPQGQEIPIPTRENFLKNLDQAAKTPEKLSRSRHSQNQSQKHDATILAVIIPPSILV